MNGVQSMVPADTYAYTQFHYGEGIYHTTLVDFFFTPVSGNAGFEEPVLTQTNESDAILLFRVLYLLLFIFFVAVVSPRAA